MQVETKPGYEHLVVGKHDGVLDVRINRPDKRNALSQAVISELRDVFTTQAADESLRVAVLRGAGDKSFAAGGDLRELSGIRAGTAVTKMAEDSRSAMAAVRRFPVPVIAGLNGDALGGGAELAVACDFRVAAHHARIGFIHGRLNISTAMGGGVDLMALLGSARALRALCRSELIGGAEALAAGLVDAWAPVDQELDTALAQFMAPMLRQRPHVVRAYKALAYAARRGSPWSELERVEAAHFFTTWTHEDHWVAAEEVLKPVRQA